MSTETTPDAGPAYTKSPHGAVAEKADRAVGKRWAPHGDQNVPADSDALNTVGAAQARGLDRQGDNDTAGDFAEGEDVERVLAAENKAAIKVAKAEKVDNSRPQAPAQRRHKAAPDASEA